jgi:hypothetical protein
MVDNWAEELLQAYLVRLAWSGQDVSLILLPTRNDHGRTFLSAILIPTAAHMVAIGYSLPSAIKLSPKSLLRNYLWRSEPPWLHYFCTLQGT